MNVKLDAHPVCNPRHKLYLIVTLIRDVLLDQIFKDYLQRINVLSMNKGTEVFVHNI